MSPREKQVAALMARGLPNKRIASELGIAYGTVAIHVRSVLRLTGSRNRTEAAFKLLSAGQ